MNKIYDKIEELYKISSRQKELTNRGKTFYTFIRSVTSAWNGVVKYSIWKLLLDESKAVYVTKDARGYEINQKKAHTEYVISTETIKDMLLSKSKEDRELAQITLTNTLNAEL